jgi:hypothetical protein
MKRIMFVVGLVLMAMSLSGCFLNRQIEPSQIGVWSSGGDIRGCMGPGVQTKWGFFDDLTEISGSTLTFQVTDPEVATRDNQLVKVLITIQARRKTDCESAKALLIKWPALLDDKIFMDTISANASEGIKVGTRAFTLTGLLDDRSGLSSSIKSGLEAVAEEYNAEIVNVTVGDVGLQPDYAAQLNEKALLTAKTDTELKRQELIRQQASNDQLAQDQRKLVLDKQLTAEQAQTSVNVEIASRAGKETAAKSLVYLQNPQAYELERLARLRDILGDKSVIYFIPAGTDLTMLYNPATNTVVPVTQK